MKAPFLLQLITPRFFTPSEPPSNNFSSTFILSSGRTGTKFFGKVLNQYKGVRSVHEPTPSYRLRMWSHAYLEGDVDSAVMRKVLYSQRRGVLKSVKSSIYIESSPFITGFTGFLDEVFNDVRVVHIVRDPREVVRSSLNQGTAKGLKYVLNRYLPYWFLDSERILETDDLEMPQEIAGSWSIVNKHIEEQGQKYHYNLFKFEDLFSENQKYLKNLVRATGIQKNFDQIVSKKSSKINKSKLNELEHWSTWPDSMCADVDYLCGQLMTKYGYGLEEEWKRKVANGYKQRK